MTAIDDLTRDLKAGAYRCGYSLSRRKCNINIADATPNRLGYAFLGCRKSYGEATKRDYKPLKNNPEVEPTDRRGSYTYTTSNQPEKKDLQCPFGFRVFAANHAEKNDQGDVETTVRWFLSTCTKNKAPTCTMHRNHHKIATEDMHVDTSMITQEEEQLRQDCAEIHIRASIQSALLNRRNEEGFQFKPSQLRHLKDKTKKIKNDLKGLNAKKGTEAEILVRTLENRKNVSFILVTYDPIEKLVLTGSHGVKKKLSLNSEMSPSPEKMFNDLKLKQGDKLLLILMFAHDEEIRLAMMHPEVLGADGVNRVCKYKREWITFAMLTGNNTLFQACRAIIPCSQQWVYDCLYCYCLPQLLGKLTMKCVRLGITDGDPLLYTALTHATKRGIMPNVMHRLCYVHHFVFPWEKEIVKHIDSKDDNAVHIANVVRYWIKSWYYNVETKAEYRVSRHKFFEYLTTVAKPAVGKPFVTEVKTFIVQKIDFHQDRIINYVFHSVCSFGWKTNNLAESMHNAMKNPNSVAAVHASMKMHTASEALITQVENRKARHSMQNAAQVQRVKTWSKLEHREYFTNFCEKWSHALFDKSKKLRCVQYSEALWIVFDSPFNDAKTCDDEEIVAEIVEESDVGEDEMSNIIEVDDIVQSKKPEGKLPITDFARVRIVRMVSEMYLTCSCERPKRFKGPCSHIFKVLGKRHPQMYSVRWSSMFQYRYLNNEDESKKDFTPIFEENMVEERSRQPDEDVYVDQLMPPAPPSYPHRYHGCTVQEFNYAMRMYHNRGKAVVRLDSGKCVLHNGKVIFDPTTVENEVESDFESEFEVNSNDTQQAMEEETNIGGYGDLESSVVHSPGAIRLLSIQARIAQRAQLSQLDELRAQSKYNHVMNLCQDAYKAVQGNKQDEDEFQGIIEDFISRKTTSEVAASTRRAIAEAEGNRSVMAMPDANRYKGGRGKNKRLRRAAETKRKR